MSPRYPRKLESTNFSKLNSYKYRRSRSTWIWWRQCWRHKRSIDIHRPVRHRLRDLAKIRRDIRENLKAPTFPHSIRINIVVPNQGEFGGDNAEDTRGTSTYTAQFATDQEILPKFDSIHKSSDYDQKWRKWHFCDALLIFLYFRSKILNSYLDRMCKQTES